MYFAGSVFHTFVLFFFSILRLRSSYKLTKKQALRTVRQQSHRIALPPKS